jgi:hypothetical protein
MRITRLLIALLATLLLCTPIAKAEDEEKQDISKEIKEQMDEILKLMKSNQDALLELSTGKDADPKRVDVKVPVPPDGAQQPPAGSQTPPPAGERDGGGDTSGAKPGSSTSQGESVARKIEELLGSQQAGSKRIPSELEKLLKMIPT